MTDGSHPRTGIALIGAGMIAPTHVAALCELRDVARLHTVVSRAPDRAASLAAGYAGPAPDFTADLGEVIENPEIQIVIVATPPNVRAAVIAPLAAAGKHILLEKPLGRTLAEAEEVVAICDTARVTLGTVFQHRARASSRAAARLIASGRLGAPGLVEVEVPNWRAQSYYDELGRGTYARDGGGVLLTQAIHTIDLALSLAGPVSRVQAMTATTRFHRMEAEDFAAAGLAFASGALGSLTASTATYPAREEMISLHFEHGSLRIGRHRLDIAWRDGATEDQVFGAAEAGEGGPVVAQHGLHQAVIADFIEAVATGRAPMATGADGLAAHRLIDAIERSSKAGRAVEI